MNVRFKQLKKRSLLLILAGLAVTVGLTAKFAILGNTLQAKEEKQLVEVFNGETLLSKDTQVSEDPATILLKSTENRLLVLPPVQGYKLYVQKNGKEQEIPIKKAEDFHQQKVINQLEIGTETKISENDTSFSSDLFITSSSEIKKELKSDVFAVPTRENPKKNNVYIQLVKDQEVILVFRDVHTNVTVRATDVSSGEIQSLFQLLEQPKENTITTKIPKSTKAADSPSSIVRTETPDNKQVSSSKTPTKSMETYEQVISAKTEKTQKTLKELIEQNYVSEDSLKLPKQFSVLNKVDSQISTASSPVVISDAKLSVQTGTSTFDKDDVAGHDSNETNGIVRSFDQVIYKVSFAIQNTSNQTQYTNIRYRLISDLPNAVTMANGNPTINAEIGNGTYQDLENGGQSSQGVLESTISDTGQIFIPVVVNVFAAKNGTQIQPTFKLEIVDAVNKETGETETINELYDSSVLPGLTIPVTIVSSKPSVGVTLVRGERKSASSIFNSSENSLVQGYDIGAVVRLSPIPGRSTNDFRGSTFPSGPITYQIKQRGTYQGAETSGSQSLSTSQYNPFELQASAIALKDRTLASWQKVGTVNVDKFIVPLAMPHGKTQAIYTSQPTGDLSKIGVYDSGTVTATDSSYVTNVTVDNYVGIMNPYTYTMSGSRTTSPLDKGFVSNEFIFKWDREKSHNLGLQNGWSQTDIDLYVDQVSYEGTTTANNSSIRFTDLIIPPGGFSGYTSFIKPKNAPDTHVANDSIDGIEVYDPYLKSGATWDSLDPGGTEWYHNAGNDHLNMGDEIYGFKRIVYGHGVNSSTLDGNFFAEGMVMWDYSSLQYDQSRPPYLYAASGLKPLSLQFKYGVAKNFTNTPPVTLKAGTYAETYALYDWYDTPAQAAQNGRKISAMAAKGKPNLSIDNINGYVLFFGAPLKVIQTTPGDVTPLGNKVTLMSQQRITKLDGTVLHDPVLNSSANPGVNKGIFSPTVFDTNGNRISNPSTFPNMIGESAWVNGFNITTKTEIEKSQYNSDETINVKVTGLMNGSQEGQFSCALNTTLPKGITYTVGTAKDFYGQSLPDPIITTNSNGTTTLRWVFPNGGVMIDDSIRAGVEINFEATSDFTEISFNSGGISGNQTVRTVGEMWAFDDPNSKDLSSENNRSSQDTFILQLIQQIVLTKQADKIAIEVGENDPLEVDTSITYTVKIANGSADALPHVKLLDVLPYNGDSRGSVIHGNYSVESVEVRDPEDGNVATDATIHYTNQITDEKVDPNSISGWSTYIPENNDISAVKDAKAFLVSIDSFPSGKVLELTVKIRPSGQNSGDVFANNTSMNSALNLPVHSQVALTKVYGRDLSGVAWYDDKSDGLIGTTNNENPETFAKNIGVKLYRTSIVNSTYKNHLVETSLTGEKFIDASGESLIKTDEQGKYCFKNLPEGEYIAEFVVGDLVTRKLVIVTVPDVGDDPAINSKANQNSYRTPAYTQPVIEELPTLTSSTNNINHIVNVNIGLIRSAKIRIFKYETGSATDANNDGQLSDVEKSTGTPLVGAVFDLYQVGTEEKIATATTDDSGTLQFDGIFEGDYTLVETKAPEGFELIKTPIEVSIIDGNQTVMLYVSNDKKTELPMAGGTNYMIILLIASSLLVGVGIVGLISYYRPSKEKKGGIE